MGDIGYLTKARQDLHKLAEPSECEHKTSDYIVSELKTWRHSFKRLHTGVVCNVKGKDASRTVAIRADMDALPIVEKGACAFRASGDCMHACGHDGHMAMALEMARQMQSKTPKYNTRIIFQFGEEGDGGADKMIGMGALDGVDEIFGFHMCPELPVGQVASTDGAMFAGTVEFDVTFGGKSCHCADASEGKDALKAAVRFCHDAQDCNADCRNNTVFHIGKLTGGTARNIVANNATAYCTLRYFDTAVMDKLMMRIEHILVAGDNAFGTEHTVTVNAVYPPLINNPASLAKVRRVCNVLPCAPRFTAEDFAFYLQKIPGCMLWLGCRDDMHTSPLHSDTFGFDERALLTGVDIYEKLLF